MGVREAANERGGSGGAVGTRDNTRGRLDSRARGDLSAVLLWHPPGRAGGPQTTSTRARHTSDEHLPVLLNGACGEL